MPIQMEVWGDYACFSRPEMKTERVSYDLITPSAARGMLEAVYWHPGLRWHIDKLYILNPIKFTNIRRNEVKSKITGKKVGLVMQGKSRQELFINTKEDIQQRAATVLQDVHYVIVAHFTITGQANASDNPGKFQDIVRRRLEKGQCYHQPYLGCREFPAHFGLYKGEKIETAYQGEKRDFGYMLYDMDYSNLPEIQPTFFRAVLKDGVLDLENCEVVK